MSTEPTSRPASPSRAEAAPRAGASAAQREQPSPGAFLAALQAASPDAPERSGAASGLMDAGSEADGDGDGTGRTGRGRRRGAHREAVDAVLTGDAPTAPASAAPADAGDPWSWLSAANARSPIDAGLSAQEGAARPQLAEVLLAEAPGGLAPRGAALGWTAAAARRAVRAIDEGSAPTPGAASALADRAHRAAARGSAAEAAGAGPAGGLQTLMSAPVTTSGVPAVVAGNPGPLTGLESAGRPDAEGQQPDETSAAAWPGASSRGTRSDARDASAGSGGHGYTAAGLPEAGGTTDPAAQVMGEAQPFAEHLLAQGDVQQMADQVSLWLAQGVSEAELRIERLGEERVDVRIEVDGARADIAFHTDAPEAREAVQQSLAELAALLREEGLTLGSMSVGDQASRQRDPSQPGTSRSGLLALKGGAGELADRLATPQATAHLAGRGRVDLYV